MKANELLKYKNCSICKKPIGATGLPLFWIVKIERFGVDLQAVRRQDGLAAMLGNPVIAQVMGPDEEMTMPLMEPLTLSVCENCATTSNLPVAALAELPGIQ